MLKSNKENFKFYRNIMSSKVEKRRKKKGQNEIDRRKEIHTKTV
jgi:hypothetical protein